MGKLFSKFLFTLLFASIVVNAQAPFTTMDSVDINNINAAVLVHGDMWWNPVTGINHCEYLADSEKNISGAGAIWMSAYDGSGLLHVAAQTYRQVGNDYWPGPLDGSGALTYATSQNWAMIWKVNRTDIQYFQALTSHTVSNTPQSILTWPGKGNASAQGNAGAPLTITNDMAPFVDVNGDGIYEPLLGEYPDIQGDQALWWVFSDNGPTHTQTNGRPLGVEVHAMAYGYNRGTLIDNVIYYEYTLVNRSSNNYTNFRIAQWDVLGLGYSFDDFIGYDSTWRMGITYKGSNDDGLGGGFPRTSYGLYPPKSAVTMIVLPGDAGTSYVVPGCFVYYNNDASIIGNPIVDTEYNNYMRAKVRTGGHFTDDFAVPGVPCLGFGSGPDCNYVFPGDPSVPTQWSECACNNNPGDRMYVLASNDFTLNAGSTQKVVLALLTTNLHDGGCPVATFDRIKIVADTAWSIYYNPLLPLSVINTTTPPNNAINIYPNPANDKLFIENTGNNTGEEYIAIYNTLGQKINLPITKNGTGDIIDVSSLPTAMYYIVYRKDNVQKTAKFVKE